MSLDQCLSCTRYEPILGQVYAILDDSQTNVTTVIDDMQMSYMTVDDYNCMTQYDKFWQPAKNVDLNKNSSEKPKTFKDYKWNDTKEEIEAKGFKEEDAKKDDYKNGFVMNWTASQLETQAHHVNEYKKEEKELNKDELDVDLNRELFKDTRGNAVEYEQLVFDIADYEIENFGQGALGEGGSGGNGGAEARRKIVDYALNAVKLCEEGKAQYSQGKRENHDDKAIDGIHYWDCSSLVEAAYRAAGVNVLSGNTVIQYPKYTDKLGGELIPIKSVNEAKPGDVICSAYGVTASTREELQKVSPSKVDHTGIYIGDGKYAHASTHYPDNPKKDIIISQLSNSKKAFAFGRPKALIELDSSGSGPISEQWSREYHQIPDALWNAARFNQSEYDLTKSNMNKYGWKDIVISVSKEKGIDPILVAALIAVESKGDPRDNDAYAGLMQVYGHYGSTTKAGMTDNIKKGIEMYKKKFTHLKQNGWSETNIHVALSAYNSGEGCVTGAAKRSNVNLSTCKIPQLGEALYVHVKAAFPGWSATEKKEYATKVLKAYNFIYNDNMLGLPRENSSQFIKPVPHEINSPFGPRKHPVTGNPNGFHSGIDLKSPAGYDIKASCAGKVTRASVFGGYGNCVEIQHSGKYSTLYAHMSAYNCKVGDNVKQGDVIGKVGSTGMSTGPHLHFEIKENGKAVDPAPFLK